MDWTPPRHLVEDFRGIVRILMVTNNYPTAIAPNGATYISRRLEAHRAAGRQVDAYALHPASGRLWDFVRSHTGKATNAGGALLDEARSGNGRYCALPYPDGPSLAVRTRLGKSTNATLTAAAQTLLRSIGDVDYDIVHGHGMYTVPAGGVAQIVAQAIGTPYVVTGHGSDINFAMRSQARAFSGILDNAAAVAYVSSALLQRARDFGSRPRREYVIPNGVDLGQFTPAGVADDEARLLGPTVAYVGNLLPVKGADRLPAIFRAVALSAPSARFVVVGDGPLRPFIERHTNGLRVTFLGRVPPQEVAAVMRRAAVLVVPSRSEGFGTVIIESHACGTPVVGSDVGGIPEAIGDARFLVAEGPDFEARFGQAVANILKTPVSDRDLRRRAATFSWDSIVERERIMYESAIEEGRGS